MIREPATVVDVLPDAVLVRCDAQQGCRRCAEGRGCGGGLFGGLLRDRLRLVRAVGEVGGLAVGDRILIGLAETTLVKAAAVMYLLPLLGIVFGAVAVQGITGGGDPAAIAGGAGGFLAALMLARRYGRSRDADPGFQPKILGRCDRGAAAERWSTAARAARPGAG